MADQLDLLAPEPPAGEPEPLRIRAAPATVSAPAAPQLILGDCFEVMATMAPDSVDAIVTDSPYGLEFMGKEWDAFRVDPRAARWSGEKSGGAGAGFGASGIFDKPIPAFGKRRTTSTCRTCGKRDAFRNPHGCGEAAEWVTIPVDLVPMEMRAFQNWCSAWAAEAYRILKPGVHLVAFGGTRTHHRLAAGLEDAGFEIRDCLMWLYGSGFPKSLDVSKAIYALAGADRESDEHTGPNYLNKVYGKGIGGFYTLSKGRPSTPEAAQWAGWGTGLKPAWEPIILARKLVDGTVAENVLKWGTGALNIDGCRIAGSVPLTTQGRSGNIYGGGQGLAPAGQQASTPHEAGRWPANLLLNDAAAAMLDEQTGESGPTFIGKPCLSGDMDSGYGGGIGGPRGVRGHLDAGGASRFFYTSKASRAEREEGLQELEPATHEDVTGQATDSPGANHPRASLTARGEIRNTHPTVKPVDLMRWLLRLVVPPGGLVVDPFVGSGTTLVAAWEEGVAVVGIVREAEYHRIAKARLAEAMRQGRLF